MKFFISVFLSAIFLAPAVFASEENHVKVIRQYSGSFLTNVAGSSLTRPPYIQAIRSKDGLEYLLGGFEKLKNRITQRRINKLRGQLKKLDFSKHMLVGVFSQPMDNYKMKIEKVVKDTAGNAIELIVNYQHQIKSNRIPPKKSIHYMLAVIPKSDYPVVLMATEMVPAKSKKRKAKLAKLITVTGRLMALRGNDLQLVPVVIKRGKKHSYYIRGEQTGKLEEHLGKVVTLQGTVSHERNSPYEWDLTVNKVVKVFN